LKTICEDFNLFVLLGYIGTFLYVLSYVLLNAKKVEGNSIYYIGMNGAAASLVLISMIEEWNGPSAIIQGTWVVISLVGITRILISSSSKERAATQ
tara:strand:+ start:476 stop:763 length:288 start_codon:yes stop_codon:yes gene_type:complete